MSTSSAPAPRRTTAPESTTSIPQNRPFAARFVDLWWVTIPENLRQYSVLLSAAWSDGTYLTGWPRVATVLVFAVFFFGFIEGGTHWSLLSLNGTFNGSGLSTGGHPDSFAQMFLLMVLGVLLGSLSANFGLMLVIGFALGDFFWAGVPVKPWERDLLFPPSLYGRIPQLAAYLTFFLLAVWPITASKFLVATANRRFRESQLFKTLLMVVVQVLFIYEWTYFAPMGVKQQWNCCSQASPVDVFSFHRTTVVWLVTAAIVGVVARSVLINIAERRNPEKTARLHAMVDRASASGSKMPQWLNALIGAAFVSLLLLGFTTFVWRAIAIFVVLAGILIARSYVLPKLSLWTSWTARVVRWPAVLRLALATLTTYIICRLILAAPPFDASAGSENGNFGPEITAILIGCIALLVLLPNGVLAPQEAEAGTRSPKMRLPVPSGVVQAGMTVVLVLLATKKALAAPCLDTRCCFLGDNGLAASAAAAGIPGLSGIAGAVAGAMGAQPAEQQGPPLEQQGPPGGSPEPPLESDPLGNAIIGGAAAGVGGIINAGVAAGDAIVNGAEPVESVAGPVIEAAGKTVAHVAGDAVVDHAEENTQEPEEGIGPGPRW